ncbi:MAG: Methyltransferase domain, partial [Solirubrobacterales bacterium]|nr:Methyltransferase domain [Solirubrobacterales bacterium]
IDLLLVDGPPAFEPEIALSRYPALPVLAERLAPDATVVLDDIDRPGELAILETWERDCDFRFEVRPAERIAIGHRR